MTEAEHQPYDRSSKWLIQHHGDSMLRLAGVKNIQAWRPAQAEVVQPRRLPDGCWRSACKAKVATTCSSSKLPRTRNVAWGTS